FGREVLRACGVGRCGIPGGQCCAGARTCASKFVWISICICICYRFARRLLSNTPSICYAVCFGPATLAASLRATFAHVRDLFGRLLVVEVVMHSWSVRRFIDEPDGDEFLTSFLRQVLGKLSLGDLA